ncbi:MAG: carbon-nitrogen hydrolase family protein [Haloechinothrix sp.]
MKQVTIAAIQAMPVSVTFNELQQGVDVQHALDLLDEAKRMGADLACFPELYPYVGEQELCAAAARLGIWVVAGLAVERDEGGWYNTATFISGDGEVVGRQPKCLPTANETRAGAVAGNGYTVVDTPFGRVGAPICADLAFSSAWLRQLGEQQVDIILNPAWWFALGDAYSSVIIGRHLECGLPIVGVDIARYAFKSGADGVENEFPPAGGRTTLTVPPPVAELSTLSNWFLTKPGGSNTIDGFATVLGYEEEIAVVTIDVEAVRTFPGYFYSEESAQVRRTELVGIRT